MKKLLLHILLTLLLCLSLTAGALAMNLEAPPENLNTDAMLHFYTLDLMGADCMLLQYKGKNLFIDLGTENQFPQLAKLIE